MDPAHPFLNRITRASFSPLLAPDIRAISVLQITNTTLLDNTGEPAIGGLYDPRLGPISWRDVCRTCKLLSSQCPGHFGHIELNVPVFHPLFMTHAFQLLRGTCFYCHHFLCSEIVTLRYAAKLKLLERGLLAEADAIDDLPTAKGLVGGKRELEDEEDEERREVQGKASYQHISLYRTSILKFVEDCLSTNAKSKLPRTAQDDAKIAMCFEKRRTVLAELVKLLPKKRCERCGAFSARMRKEGHTKVMVYSLALKQALAHRLQGRQMPDVLRLEAEMDCRTRQGSVQSTPNSHKRRRRSAAPVDHNDSESSVGGYRRSSRDPSRNVESDSQGSQASEGEESRRSKSTEADEDARQDLTGRGESMQHGDQILRSPSKKQKQTEVMMLAQEARAHLRLLFRNECELCNLVYGERGHVQASSKRAMPASADMFFLDVVPVPPTRFRPASILGDQTLECPQNLLLTDILSQTMKIRDINQQLSSCNRPSNVGDPLPKHVIESMQLDGLKFYRQMLEACVALQVVVNSLMDSTKNPGLTAPGKLPPQGIKQILEKKEGLFRMNMMGKRVNYAARSVISPDINIETNEIGVPPVFAKKLTFPEFVTAHNFERLHLLVCNGPKKHPGAVFVQDEDGAMVSLDRVDEEGRRAIANTLLNTSADADRPGKHSRPDIGLPITRTPTVGKRVHRHLDDGDILILNRQPTLHKPSMMCHRARILKGEKTIRMHYANCNSYNADFDGDEMNMHFPQNLIAQSEARTIANNDNQYLVPTSGNPLRGLIQDHVVAGVWMTNKDTFFSRENYYQIIYGALRPENAYSGQGRVLTVPPAVWKPRPLWTGKQLISTVLKNIKPAEAAGLNLSSTSTVPAKQWGTHDAEKTVHFYDGELLSGVIDKSQIGASSYGLVHSVYDIYGAEVCGKLLSILSRLFTKFLQHRAFTCRMDDLLLTPAGDATRSRLLAETSERGLRATLSTIGMSHAEAKNPRRAVELGDRLQEVLRNDAKMADLDKSYNAETSSLQTAINSQCLPFGLAKPFPWNHMQMMTGSGAKGTPVNASQITCLLGQQALEGRRVPVMVSGKTLPCFRPFETEPRAGGFVAQRFLTGIRPQEYYFHCMAGREGLIDTAVKTSRSGYLQRCLIKHLEGVRIHYDHTVRNSDSSVLQFLYGEDCLDVCKQKHLYEFEFSILNRASLIERLKPRQALGEVDSETAEIHNDQVMLAIGQQGQSLPLPTMSIYSPSLYYGSISEKFTQAVCKYQQTNPNRLLKARRSVRKLWPPYIKAEQLVSPEIFRSLMLVRFMKGIVEPGEAVGLLASQGVGEPSTQMTLNTFHFAGHGAANVTLGIPRLREIVMTASASIKTPTMKFPIKDYVTDTEFANFIKKTAKLTLSQVVDRVIVEERLTKKDRANRRFKVYSIRLQLYPSEEYCSVYSIKVEAVFASIVRAFMPLFERCMMREFKTRDKDIKNQFADIGKGSSKNMRPDAGVDGEDAQGDADGDEIPARRVDEADLEDGDADDQKRARQKDELDYDKDGAESDDDGAVMDDQKLRELTDAQEGVDQSDEEDADSIGQNAEETDAQEQRLITLRQLQEEAETFAKYITSVTFDEKWGNYCDFTLQFNSASHKLLLVGLIEQCCRKAVIQEIPGIARALPAQADNPHNDHHRYGMTEGANLRAAWSFGYETIELDRLYSNDIHAMLQTYGVEAARCAIIKEMSAVFEVYGITVDYRHLTLIADYMTCEGGFKPFNRSGLSSHVSPFLKASFETTAKFLTDATIFGDFDDLSSPSASIVLGQAPCTGTNSFDLLVKTKG